MTFSSAKYLQVEVWNRTLDPIYLLDQDGKRLDVPACGNAVAPVFHVNDYAIWFEQGRYLGMSTGGSGGPPNERLIVMSARDDPIVYAPAFGPPPALPKCEGHPTVENAH